MNLEVKADRKMNWRISKFSHFHISKNIEQGTRNNEFRSKGR
jgi:hypothetical protein